jgi:hypothetical protein
MSNLKGFASVLVAAYVSFANSQDIDGWCSILQVTHDRPRDDRPSQLLADLIHGNYIIQPEKLGDRPVFKHVSNDILMFYSHELYGLWIIASANATFQPNLSHYLYFNQADNFCPCDIDKLWNYHDVLKPYPSFDDGFRVSCISDPCSSLRCGHKAICKQNE